MIVMRNIVQTGYARQHARGYLFAPIGSDAKAVFPVRSRLANGGWQGYRTILAGDVNLSKGALGIFDATDSNECVGRWSQAKKRGREQLLT